MPRTPSRSPKTAPRKIKTKTKTPTEQTISAMSSDGVKKPTRTKRTMRASSRSTASPKKPLISKKTQKKQDELLKPVVQTTIIAPPPQLAQPPTRPMQTPPPRQQSTSRMSPRQCFIYGGLICLAGTVLLGLFLGLVVVAPLGTQFEQSRIATTSAVHFPNKQAQALDELQSTISQSTTSPSSDERGFYGTLLSKESGVLMVRELDPSLPLEKKSGAKNEKTFAVRVSDKTGYTYQKPRDGQDANAPLFSPQDGTLDNLKTDMYVFIATSDDISKTQSITASHILYSEKSPFAE